MSHDLPQAIILAGSSGAGKTTIAQYLLRYNPRFSFSISACTRRRRPHEVDGQDYYFLSVEAFKEKIAQKAFIEWEEVYAGNYYGTLKTEMERIIAAGKIAIFDLDVRGGLRLKSVLKHHALAIYVQAPSSEVLVERLRERKTEKEEEIAARMRKVEKENSVAHLFDDVLVNGVLHESLIKAKQLADSILHQS